MSFTVHAIAQPPSYLLQTIAKANTHYHCQITPSGSEHETLCERQHERLSSRCPNLQGHACVCVCVCVFARVFACLCVLEEKRRIRCHRLVPSGLHCAHSLTVHSSVSRKVPTRHHCIYEPTHLVRLLRRSQGFLLLSNVNAKADRYAPYSPSLARLRWSSCSRSAGYRGILMHTNNKRAGSRWRETCCNKFLHPSGECSVTCVCQHTKLITMLTPPQRPWILSPEEGKLIYSHN